MVEREKILCGWGRVCVRGVARRGSYRCAVLSQEPVMRVLCSGFQAMDFAGAECVPRTRSMVVSGLSCLTCQSSPPLKTSLFESPQQASSTGAACVNFTRSGFSLGLGPKEALFMSYRRTVVSQEEAMRWFGVCGEKATDEIASVGGERSSWRLADMACGCFLVDVSAGCRRTVLGGVCGGWMGG